MITKELLIIDPVGIHARPAAEISKESLKYKSNIMLKVNEKKVSTKSVVTLLSSGIKGSQPIELIIDGEDENEAMEALVQKMKEINLI